MAVVEYLQLSVTSFCSTASFAMFRAQIKSGAASTHFVGSFPLSPVLTLYSLMPGCSCQGENKVRGCRQIERERERRQRKER